MSDTNDQQNIEENVDFGEEATKPEEELTLEGLDNESRLLDQQNEEERKRIAELASENKEKIEAATQMTADKDTIDERSIFIKEVDYHVTPDELMAHFSSCGAITRLRILTNRDDTPKGAAYIEFEDPESVKTALLFNGCEFHGRKLVVVPKRKTLPRHMLKRGRGRGRGGYHRGAYRPY